MSRANAAAYPDAIVEALAQWTVERIDAGKPPLVLGLSGLQGSGKSTLATQLVAAVAARGIDAVGLSLDDAYLTREQRRQLALEVHPLFATRGVPGTHDLALLHATLDALAHASPDTPAAVPRFDKGSDDRLPTAAWTRVARAPRLVVLEGWCLGVPPQPPEALQAPVNDLERDEDADGRWRRHVNAALAGDYAALWSRLDRLLVLQAPSFDVVRGWRDEQEIALRNADAPHAMSPAAMDRFIAHFERLSRHALATLPDIAHIVMRLDARRGTAMPGAGQWHDPDR